MKLFELSLTRDEVEAVARLIEKEVGWTLPAKVDPDSVRTRFLLFSVLNKLPRKETLDANKQNS